MGQTALTSHAKGEKHKAKELTDRELTAKCISISSYMESQPSTSKSNTFVAPVSDTRTFYNENDQLKAETLWSLKMASSNYSFSSCSDVNFLLKEMFPDSNIAQNFKMSETKSMYIMTHGIAPYVQSLVQKHIQEAKEYVLLFDETLNKNMQKKQMDLLVRYWDMDKISSRYFKSVFFGHGTALDLHEIMEKHVHCTLGYSDLVQISMDGPNVNWALYDRLEQTLNGQYDKHLLNTGSCGLHIIHNAFKHGAVSTGWEVGHYLEALHTLFKDVPARRDDYINVTGSTDFPYKFCSHRWVENVRVVNRALELHENIQKYVNSVHDKKCKDPKTKSFSTVKQWVVDPLGKAKLAAFAYVALPIVSFLTRYQSDQPLMPYLSDDLIHMMRALLNRIVKPEIMTSSSDGASLLKIDLTQKESLRSLKDMDLGFVAAEELRHRPGSELDRRKFRENSQMFIVAFITKLNAKSPLKYSIVRNMSCLAPENIVQDRVSQINKFQKVLRAMVEARRLKSSECDSIMLEFSEFAESAAEMPRFCEFKKSGSERLDTLYSETVAQNFKKLWPVIRTVLLLSHGQATVERSFTINKSVTTENIGEHTLIARRAVSDHLHHVGGLQNVVITKEMIKSVQLSRLRYGQYLTEKKEAAAVALKQNKRKQDKEVVKENKKKLKKLQDDRQSYAEKADQLAMEAENAKDPVACIVQSNALRKKGNEKAEEAQKLLNEIQNLETEVANC